MTGKLARRADSIMRLLCFVHAFVGYNDITVLFLNMASADRERRG